MKYYKILDCDCLEKIQEEALSWIESNTTLIDHADKFWNEIDYKHFILQNPTLVKWCTDRKLPIREVAVLVAHPTQINEEQRELHIDVGPLRSKINFPILNTKDTYTEWYEVLDADPFGEYQRLGNRDLSKLKKLGEVEAIYPVAFNSSIPHTIRIDDTAKYPRIQISIMFFKSIDYMLEEEQELADV